jgi:tetratricopeptide (TPR) repeat protein
MLAHLRYDFEAAQRHAQSCIDVGEASTNTFLSLGGYFILGMSQASQGQYQTALDSLHKALKLSDVTDDRFWRARLLNTLGWVYRDLFSLELAGRYDRESLELARASTPRLTEAEGKFQLADAVFTIPELSFRLPNGKFAADAKLDFNPVPFTYTMNAKGEPLDLNGMVGATEGFGPATLELEAKGAGPETKDLKGNGQVRFAEGRFPDAKMFTQIDAALGKKAVVGSPYKATEASFRMENNRVTMAPFRFESGDARLDLQGTMSLQGPVDFDLSLATPRVGLRIVGVGSSALDLLADDQGWVPVPIDITGTLEDPKVRPDVKALASQAGQGAKREATEKATDALRGLLKKKNE